MESESLVCEGRAGARLQGNDNGRKLQEDKGIIGSACADDA